jgi:hypothetical protein
MLDRYAGTGLACLANKRCLACWNTALLLQVWSLMRQTHFGGIHELDSSPHQNSERLRSARSDHISQCELADRAPKPSVGSPEITLNPEH